ncbi:hypothetical protein GSJ08_09635 [Bordetella pertussis]
MNWEVGDFQFLKSGSDEPCIQPIESSHLARRAGLICIKGGQEQGGLPSLPCDQPLFSPCPRTCRAPTGRRAAMRWCAWAWRGWR